MSSLAFKEWRAIVGALATGGQIVILRKGGIAEGAGGFGVKARRFWLLPTAFHAQKEKTKPAAHPYFDGDAGPELSFYAEVEHADFISDWEAARRLDPFHLWTEATIRERFDWAKPPGLHLLMVRVFRVHDPIALELTPQMAGCKSWIEVPSPLVAGLGTPILNEPAFAVRCQAVRGALAGG